MGLRCWISILLFTPVACAQSASSTFLTSVATTVSKLHQQIALNGSATLLSGPSPDSGSAVLTGRADGSFDLNLTFSKGKRQEVYGPYSSRACKSIDSNGSSHPIGTLDCFAPIPWFAPALLLPASSTSAVEIDDLGESLDQDSVNRHVILVRPFGKAFSEREQKVLDTMGVRVFYDKETFLPQSLEYSLHADENSTVLIPIRVVFSDYRLTSGLELPFRIDRYRNRSLELSITLESVSIQ